MTLTCPGCGRNTEQVRRADAVGLYFRCVCCREVFMLVGNVLVAGEPPEMDESLTEWVPLWK